MENFLSPTHSDKKVFPNAYIQKSRRFRSESPATATADSVYNDQAPSVALWHERTRRPLSSA